MYPSSFHLWHRCSQLFWCHRREWERSHPLDFLVLYRFILLSFWLWQGSKSISFFESETIVFLVSSLVFHCFVDHPHLMILQFCSLGSALHVPVTFSPVIFLSPSNQLFINCSSRKIPSLTQIQIRQNYSESIAGNDNIKKRHISR
jgi:hypothetical protein